MIVYLDDAEVLAAVRRALDIDQPPPSPVKKVRGPCRRHHYAAGAVDPRRCLRCGKVAKPID